MNKEMMVRRIVAAGAVIGTFALPLGALAQTPTGPASRNFCDRLGGLNEQLSARQGERESAALRSVQERAAQREMDRAARDAQRDVRQMNQVTRWEAIADVWGNRVTTPEQRVAVGAFQAEMQTAVRVRAQAIDIAVTEFRNGVDVLIRTQQLVRTGALDALRAALAAALSTARMNCGAGDNPATVHAKFEADLVAARAAFRASMQAPVPDISEGIAALSVTRRAAVQAAQAAFTTSLRAATARLEAAFGVRVD